MHNSEELCMAVESTTTTGVATPAASAPQVVSNTGIGRKSYAQIKTVLEMPNLVQIQLDSFRWFMTRGLEELLKEVSPITDHHDKMALYLSEPRFDEPWERMPDGEERDRAKRDPRVAEVYCRERDMTYSARLRISAKLMIHETGEVKETGPDGIFIGDFPMMTSDGTFIINGAERVVVSQLVRSPGAYFERKPDPATGRQLSTAKLIPNRGAWLEFETSNRDVLSVKIDRKRKMPETILLRALGFESDDELLAQFSEVDTSEDRKFSQSTIDKESTKTQDEALVELYRRMRPGDPPTRDNAERTLRDLFFNERRYDLARVGRHKLNQRLHLDDEVQTDSRILEKEDLVEIVRELIRLNNGQSHPDDIDHLGNRRIRAVGELIQMHVRTGFQRLERGIKERMTIQDIENVTANSLISTTRPVIAAVREFFGGSQLSQFMDQTNPLAELTHKRRLSALGPGGLSRDRAGMDVRDVHPSHYGRICPVETPEGPNIGLIGYLASYGRINAFGFVETPYRKVTNGRVSDDVVYLSADEEDEHVIAQANAPLAADGRYAEERVLVRTKGGEVEYVPGAEVDYMDVAARQMVSAATALIPFLEHDDANRALMGSNMMRQAVPLVRSEAPLVGTAMEYRAALDSGDVVRADKACVVQEVSADVVTVANDDGTYQSYPIAKFNRSNQGTSYNQRVMVEEGARLEVGGVIADGPATDGGEMALGRNLLVAFMPWEGHNYEDAIILSSRLVQDDVLSSIHIEEHEVDARDTKLGPEEITRDIPNVSEEVLADLDERGIIRIGAEVRDGDLLVGKVTPKGETELTPEERLLRAIFGEKAREVRDTSLKVPHGETGTVIGVKVFDKDEGDDLPPGVNQLVRVFVANKRKITDGDKLAGRHGNKGVISKILPIEDMPFLEDGTPVDVVLNPLGVPGRMNVGQILEIHLGWAASRGWKIEGSPDWAKLIPSDARQAEPGTRVSSPVFDGAREDEITGLLDSTLKTRDGVRLIDGSGKTRLFDGRSGEPFPEPVSVGYMYILKLHHLVDDKIHARSTGPYSMITQQPLGGKAQFGGQRFGEMEVWALEAYGAAYALQELLTIKSDDVTGRVKVYEAIVKGENIPEPGIPESFKVLIKEMQSLCLNVEVLSSDGTSIDMKDPDEDVFRAAEELGIDLSRREPSSVEEV